MKYLLTLLTIVTFQLTAAELTGVVTKVLDGDTIQIVDSDNGRFKVRLADIDAPELSQPYGFDSMDMLYRLVHNKQVNVKFLSIDIYGRIIGSIYVQGPMGYVSVNAYMLSNGGAWYYSVYAKNRKLRQYELDARANKLGLWAGSNPIAPWEYRKSKKKE